MSRALVIGGSLGGLFAAHWLRAIGWDVAVFERVEDDLASRGAGIGTHEELLKGLRRLGLPADESIGVLVRKRICLDRSGRRILELDLPQFMSAWARIYRLLKDGFPAPLYRFGVSLERIEQDADGITAILSDGSRERGDLLIGADGLRSTVRGLLASGAQPRYAGYIAWRGMADEWDFPPEVHAELFEQYAFCLPEGEMMLSYPVPGRDNDTRPGRRGYNFIWYRPTDEFDELPLLCTDAAGHCHGMAIPPPLIRPEVIAKFRADAHALLAPQIAGIVTRMAQPFFQSIFDLESPSLVSGRAVLLGDAAFVARPHVGMGVTKAALDAEFLAAAIRESGNDLGAALTRYDNERRQFGSRVVARARRLGAYIEARHKSPAARAEHERQPAPEILMREIGSMAVNLREIAG